jgi:menaquinone-dependent protoporphyrinogen IX oxidase
MKVGIYVHSNTGNTMSVAEKLMSKLQSGGHTVQLEKIEPVGGENINEGNIANIQFDKKPNFDTYDVLIFAAPVRAFSISPVISSYLNGVTSMKDKKVSLFVTQHLPYPWMGGKHAISQMRKLCEVKGASILDTGIVNWKNKSREEKIMQVVETLSRIG